MVAVGSTVYYSRDWKTFPDFLAHYIKKKIGEKWGNAELQKPLRDRHPLLQWYDAYCRYQAAHIKTPGEVHSSPVTGIVACYLGTAYALYLLEHNVELQERLIRRLKDPGNFQGAYYELIVSSILIRAGFELTLEDETDGDTKHCEFAAVSKVTGKRYWVEAKMRAVTGLLGRTNADGGNDQKPLSRMIPHLNAALQKPAADERLIFIDLNAPSQFSADGSPDWLEPAMTRLERYEKDELKVGETAYVFVTNFSFHRELEATPQLAASPFGLGFPDFNRRGQVRLIDAYKAKQKHIDAHNIGHSIEACLRFPTTFEGNLPSEAFDRPTDRVVLGETYHFDGVDGRSFLGTVTSAIVDETAGELVVSVSEIGGSAQILRKKMSDESLSEYREFGDAYLGTPTQRKKNAKNEFELFEWFVETHKNMPREKVLAWFSTSPYYPELEKLNDEDLLFAYCEALVASVVSRSNPPKAST